MNHRLSRLALCCCALLATLVAGPGAHASETEEQYYVVTLNGQRAGWASEAQRTREDRDRIVTAGRMNMTIGRGTQQVTLDIATEFIETLDGEPVSMLVSQALGAQVTETLYEFGEDSTASFVEQGEHQSRSFHPPLPDDVLPPAAAQRMIARAIEEGRETIAYRAVDPTTGPTPYTITMERLGRENIEVAGKTVPAITWTMTRSDMPTFETKQFLDEQGVDLKSMVNLGGMRLVSLAADRELALSPYDPPELMARTLVEVGRPIEDPRGTRRATYLLTFAGGDAPDLPSTGAQRATALGLGQVRVAIDLDDPLPADDAEGRSRYLAPSTALDTRDPAVAELAARAAEGSPDDPAGRAEAIRRFVHGYIDSKTLGVGFATASDVCRTREGDCTEHAVLYAALLRANGIPSRVVSGLIYADRFLEKDRVFGYHMWTQALLPGDDGPVWVDLDPSLPPGTPTDATHITLGTSALRDGDVLNSMVTLADALGRLSIEVESAE